MKPVLPTLDRVRAIAEKCDALQKFHYQKSNRARTNKKLNEHWDLYRYHKDFYLRAMDLFSRIRLRQKPDYMRVWDLEFQVQQWQNRNARKAERKAVFDSTYRVSLWFMRNSFGSDYGTNLCDRCARTFHHSPSRVYLGMNMKYDCACGHCVNLLTNKKIFE